MKTTYLLICLTAIFASVSSLSCSCENAKCKPVKCKAGIVKDPCGCCDVCAKTEGQKCGGPWDMLGQCAEGLSCVIRVNGQIISQGSTSRHGHCEQRMCAQKTCSLHQKCVVLNSEPVCECPRMCKHTGHLVCGLSNGKEYASLCDLRRFECKIGAEIGHKNGPCKRCAYEGKPYKFNEQIRRPNCEVCTCDHGQWRCKVDIWCLKKKQTTKPVIDPILLSVKTPCDLSPARSLRCPSGSTCQTVPEFQETGVKFVMGICVPQAIVVDPYPETAPTDLPTATESVCPEPKCMPCKHGYVIDSNGCQTCQCLPKRKSVCKLPVMTGPCKGLFKRYFFNVKKGKCQSFIFGGCQPNGNNFKTRKACEAECMMM